jgi:arylsulfatase A-like enzyme
MSRSVFRRPVALVLSLIVIGWGQFGEWAHASAGDGHSPKGVARHVFLIDWDGFDPDYIGRVPTPTLSNLASHGSLSVATSTFQTTSNPARASMATGAFPEVHGNSAYYYFEKGEIAVGQSRYLAAETIAETLAAEGMTLASVQWYMVHGHGAAYRDPEHLHVEPGGPCSRKFDTAIDILHRRPVDSDGQAVTVPRIPDFVAVYCKDLDALGHDEGAESPNLRPLLSEMDAQLGRLVQTTKELGIYEDSTFLLTSDHGMTTWNRSLLPQVVTALTAAGYRPEIVPVGQSATPATEVIIVPNAVRIAAITLRGKAATPEGRAQVRDALEQLPEISRVLDRSDLRALHSEAFADLVPEAKPPWGFGLALPDERPQGGHGSTKEMQVPLLLAGAGIERGVAPTAPRIVDIAPTISALLGVRPPADAQGHSLLARHHRSSRGLPLPPVHLRRAGAP